MALDQWTLSSGDWVANTNGWSAASPPGATDTAEILAGDSVSITSPIGSATVEQIGSLVMDDGSSASIQGQLYVGEAGSGETLGGANTTITVTAPGKVGLGGQPGGFVFAGPGITSTAGTLDLAGIAVAYIWDGGGTASTLTQVINLGSAGEFDFRSQFNGTIPNFVQGEDIAGPSGGRLSGQVNGAVFVSDTIGTNTVTMNYNIGSYTINLSSAVTYDASNLTVSPNGFLTTSVKAAALTEHLRDNFLHHAGSDFLMEKDSGLVWVGEMELGVVAFTQVSVIGLEWSFHGNGDFLGDGRADYLMQNTAGTVYIGEVVNGQAAYTSIAAIGSQWTFVGAGDFLGHGRDDFLIEGASGVLEVGEYANSQTALTQVSAVGPEWKFVGSGDFLGDGKGDFLMENSDGKVFVGEIVGGQATYTYVSAVGPEWKFVGTGNFLGDGKIDYLMENTLGMLYAGEVVNGQASYTQLTTVGSQWTIVGSGDYLGEGHDQILMKDAAGDVDIGDWIGHQQLSLTAVGLIDSTWTFHN